MQVCEDAPAELEVNLGGAMQRASDVLIPKLLGLFTSPHDGIRAMVSTLERNFCNNSPRSHHQRVVMPSRLRLCRLLLSRINRNFSALHALLRCAPQCVDPESRDLLGLDSLMLVLSVKDSAGTI